MKVKMTTTKIVDAYIWKKGINPSLDPSLTHWMNDCLKSGKVRCVFPYDVLYIEHPDHVDRVDCNACIYKDGEVIGHMSLSSFRERCELLL